jgi:hypothetical protein
VEAGYLTIENQDCSTPNALLTSFLQLSFHIVKCELAGPRGVGIVFTNVNNLDSIGKIVAFGILVDIDFMVARWSMAFNKSSKH